MVSFVTKSTMINPKMLIAISRTWQKFAAIGRRRISMSKADAETCKKSVASRGHFIIYTSDGRRFAVPLAYHKSPIFQELFKICEEEFGFSCDGPITLPCDAAFMEYIVSLLQSVMPKDLERAVLSSMATGRCSTFSCLDQPHSRQSILVHGH